MQSIAPISRKANITLWSVQAVLAALFLFAGGFKLITPVDVLAAQTHLSGEFMRFIGVCEFLGGLGLVLPGLARIRTELTSLAAAGLVIIMTGATIISAVQGPVAGAIVPVVVGILAATVARSRREWTVRREQPEPEVVLQRAA
ncbi:MAG: DoxX family protein [Gemmatimonadaceae bacterium]